MADLIVTNTDVEGGKGVAAIAAVQIAAGETVYLDTSALANLAANTTSVVAALAGIALNDAEVGQPVGILKTGVITMNAIFVKGEVYVLSDTAGGIRIASENATGDFLTIIGWGLTTTTMQVNIAITGVAWA